jgi:hypothetical protein
MVSEQPTRKMVSEFKRAGWSVISTDGRHTKFGCPSGRHTLPLPTTHRRLAGVVRKARQAINECEASR